MKKPVLVFFLIVALLLAAPVCAEIYKYTDENGQKRWTDDLSQVPKEQRPTAQRIETGEETPTDAVAGEAASAPDTEAKVQNAEEPGETAELSREALEQEKADLDTQYQQLMEERQALEQIKVEALDANARTELNQRITAYNGKTEQYEAQLNAFNEKINTYNQKIMSKPTPPSE